MKTDGDVIITLVSSGFHEKKYLLTITVCQTPFLVALANRLERKSPILSEETPKATDGGGDTSRALSHQHQGAM